MLRIALAFILSCLLPSNADAERRVALVIGNSAYAYAGDLANPTNDATDISNALKTRGFEVVDGLNLDKAAFDRKVRDFATALSGADVGVFFYAGHGLQVGGENYLVPVDAQGEAAALDFEMVPLALVQRVMERQSQTNIIFLDACRNNPLARNLARAMGTRSVQIGPGLAAVESGVGTLISFSTQPGNVATDGRGRNSPFAGALAKQIATSTESLGDLLIAVRNDVMKETGGKQVPWEHSALRGRVYLGDRPTQVGEVHLSKRTVQVSDLFRPEDMTIVKDFASKKEMPIPAFKIYKPGSNIPETMRRFIGVWGSDKGSTSGRAWGLIIEDVSAQGMAIGYTVFGPPQSASIQSPAAYYPAVGKITDNKLVIKGKRTEIVATLGADNRIVMTETYVNGVTGSALLKPIWQLVKAERSTQR
jgi:Caspase domain